MNDIKSYFAKNQSQAHETFVHSDGAKGAAKTAGQGDLVGQLVKLAGDITVGVYSTNKQIALQKDLAKLSSSEQAKLAEELSKSQTSTQKLALLQQAQNTARNRNITLIVVGSLIGIVGIVIAVVLVKRKK